MRKYPCVALRENGTDMSERVFCYHCRSYHAGEQVRLIQTKNGKRWRCDKSLGARLDSVETRDAFGAAVRRLNQALAGERNAARLPHCVREVLGPLPRAHGSGEVGEVGA